MKRDLVNYETALLANKKGFDLECDYAFDVENNNKLINFLENKVDEFVVSTKSNGFYSKDLNSLESIIGDYFYGDNSEYYLVCPTRQTLLNWLRTSKNIYIQIFTNSDDNEWQIEIYYIIKDINTCIHYEPNVFFKNYEECLNYGLIKTLELCW